MDLRRGRSPVSRVSRVRFRVTVWVLRWTLRHTQTGGMLNVWPEMSVTGQTRAVA